MSKKTGSEVTPFFYESKEIRVIKDDNDEPWWYAVDVCNVLSLGNTGEALKRIDDDEKMTIRNSDSQGGKGPQSFTVVNEPGLYTLIIRSNKPEAKAFKRWITHEVLPQIRKTGSYGTASQALTPAQQRDVQVAIAERVYAAGIHKGDKIVSSSQFQALHRSVKNRFHVGSYKDIPASCFDDLMAYIATCPIEAAKAIESPSHVDENALALRVADAVMKQVQPQVIRYEKTTDIGDLIVNMQKDIKDMAIRMKHEMLQMKHELVRELKPVATITHYDNIPMPREQWQKTWDTLCVTHEDISKAVERFRRDVTDLIPKPDAMTIPKGADVLEHIRLHYSAMEKAARQINVLSELLMWKSPKVAGVNMELVKPRY